MRYRNKRTGNVIETTSVISGPDFESIPDAPKEVKETKPKTTTTAKRAKK